MRRVLICKTERKKLFKDLGVRRRLMLKGT